MGSILGKLAMAIGGVLATLFSGWRTWIGAVLVKAVLIVALYNLGVRIIQEVLTWGVQKLGSVSGPAGSISDVDLGTYSALAAWFANISRLPECFAFILSVILLKFTLRKIPFLRW